MKGICSYGSLDLGGRTCYNELEGPINSGPSTPSQGGFFVKCLNLDQIGYLMRIDFLTNSNRIKAESQNCFIVKRVGVFTDGDFDVTLVRLREKMPFYRRKSKKHHRTRPRPTPQEALKALHERVEEARKYPIQEAEQRLGVRSYSRDGDTAGYLSPHEYDEVEELPQD